MGKEEREPQKKRGIGQIISMIVGVALCVVFIPVILINLTLIVRSYTDEENIPSVFGISPVIVLSGSMSPEFEAGDLIFIQKTDPFTLGPGDVICYIGGDEESAVTHRIIEVQQQNGQPAYITQGDANNTADGVPVTPDEVQGKYTGVYFSGLGNVAIFMQSTTGMILFIVLPLVLLVLWDVGRRAFLSRKDKGKEKELEAELERLRAQVQQAQPGGGVSNPAGTQTMDILAEEQNGAESAATPSDQSHKDIG